MPEINTKNSINLEEIAPRRCPKCGAEMRRQVTENGVKHVCDKCGYAVIERRGSSLSAEYRTQRRLVKLSIERLISDPYEPENCPRCGTPSKELKKKSTLADGVTYICPKCKEVQPDRQSLECLNKLYELGNQYPDVADRDPIFHYLYIQILTYNFQEWNDQLSHHIDQLGRSAYDADDKEEVEAYGRMFARLQFEHAVATGELKKCPVCKDAYIKKSERMCDDCRARKESDEYKSKKAKRKKAIIALIVIIALCATAFGVIYKFMPELIFGTSTIEYYIDGYKRTTTVSYSQNIEIEKPELTGYNFLGLYDAPSEGNMIVDSTGKSLEAWSSTQNSGTITLYPRWERIVYTIKLDVNGGTGKVLPEYTVEYEGDMPALSAEATRVGYNFVGWAIDKNGTRMVSDSNGIIVGGKEILIKQNYAIPEEGVTAITLYAQWEPMTYTVTLDKNGGKYTGNTTLTVKYDELISLGVATRDGYKFAGWYDGTTAVTNESGEMLSKWTYLENKVLTAQWNARTYSITLKEEGDGGTADGPENVKCGETATFVATEITGYSFVGWYVSGTKKCDELTYSFEMPANNVKLTAKWAIKEFNVALDANGGSVEGANEVVVKYNEKPILKTPIRAGYTFLGWYLDTTAITDNVGAMLNAWNYLEDKELTAKWEAKTYNIALTTEVNGGTANGAEEAICDEEVTFVSTTLPGYTFDGWYVGGIKKSSETTYSFQMPANNVEIIAKWTANKYNVTLDVAGGTLVGESTATVTYDATLNFGVPTRTGYTFLGWYLDTTAITDNVGAMLSVWNYLEDKELTAKWEAKTYSIALTTEVNGGTANGAEEAKCDEEVTFVSTTLPGYTFDGWYVGGIKKSSEATYSFQMPANDVEIIAKWTANEYTISLNANGGNHTGKTSVTILYDNSLSLGVPTRTGYTFLGWYLETTQITDNAGAMLSVWNYLEDKELTAKWEEKTYKIILTTSGKGGNATAPENAKCDASVECIANVNSGYTFDGWYVGGIKKCAEATYSFQMPANNVEIIAKWTANEYTVTLNANGGNYTGETSVAILYGGSLNLGVPSRAGYNFLGWYLDTTAITDNVGAMLNVWNYLEDKELTAKWEAKTYNIALTTEVNGGTANGAEEAKCDEEVTFVSTTLPGYTFDGWYVGGIKKSSETTYSFQMPANDVEIVAKWTANEYTVTLNANGGSLTEDSEYVVVYDTKVDFEVPTRTGYTFLGWYLGTTAITDNNASMVSAWGYATDKTLTAKWQINTYTLTVKTDGNGGTATAPASVKYGATAECVASVNDGYTFDGWYVNGAKESSDLAYNLTMPARDIQITAKWTPNKYNVTLNLNGGSGSTKATATYNSVMSFTVPSRTGYSFVGWYLDSTAVTNANGKMLSAWKYLEDKELTAHWQINKYKVTIDKNISGGSVSGVTTVEYNSQATYTATTNSGYTFIGWYKNSSKVSSESTYTFTMPASDVTLIAKWKANTYVATLDAGEGTLSSSNTVNVEYNTKPTFPVPTRTGYTFNGWYLGSTAVTYSSGSMKYSWSYTENKAFTASWSANAYSVVLNANGGSVSGSTTVTVRYDETATLKLPTRTGYTFNGWYLDGTAITDENATLKSAWKYTSGKTLIANWTAKQYTATLNANGGTVSGSSDISVIYDTTPTFAVPTRTGYIFLGWYIDSTAVTDTSGKMKSAWNYSDNKTLSAKWQANPKTYYIATTPLSCARDNGYNYDSPDTNGNNIHYSHAFNFGDFKVSNTAQKSSNKYVALNGCSASVAFELEYDADNLPLQDNMTLRYVNDDSASSGFYKLPWDVGNKQVKKGMIVALVEYKDGSAAEKICITNAFDGKKAGSLVTIKNNITKPCTITISICYEFTMWAPGFFNISDDYWMNWRINQTIYFE